MLATLTSYTKDSVHTLSGNRCSARVRCIPSPAAYKASQLSPSELIEDTTCSQGGCIMLRCPPTLAFEPCGLPLRAHPIVSTYRTPSFWLAYWFTLGYTYISGC